MSVFILYVGVGFLFLAVDKAHAITGVCSNCHVMHASEAGTAADPGSYTNGPQDRLLNDTCLGCHTEDNGAGPGLPANQAPGVFGKGTGGELAGGNFDHSDGNELLGHNPVGITADSRYTGSNAPPGYTTGFPSGGSDGDLVEVGATWGSNSLTCAGIYGCHGKHSTAGLDGAHHANVTGASVTGNTVGTSYRFLYGIDGWEDADYELVTGVGSHNIYYAVDRSGSDDLVGNANTATISYLCAQCHGIFHSGVGNAGISNTATTGASPWIRHPTDVVMDAVSATGDFDAYGTYDSNVPLGSSDVSDGTIDTAATAADRIVMCLTCHRAHASQWPDALRWDYALMNAGGGATTGCLKCHDAKR